MVDSAGRSRFHHWTVEAPVRDGRGEMNGTVGGRSSDRYDYSTITASSVRESADDCFAGAEQRITQALDVGGPRTFDNTLVPLSDAAAAVWRAEGRAAFTFGQVHPDEGVRDALSEVRERATKWRVGLARRDELAKALRSYAESDDGSALTGARRRVLDLWLRDIKRSGYELDPASRTELAALQARIAELGIRFEQNLAEPPDAMELDSGDLAGLSPVFVGQLPDAATLGAKRLPIIRSVVYTFLEQSERRDLRREALFRLHSRAVEKNEPILEELLALRRRAAQLLGASSWSQFANEARMSGGEAAVRQFLDRILAPLQKLAKEERAEMRSLLAADGVPGDVQAWDWMYCHERQRRELGVDSVELTAHFPVDAVLGGLFDLVRNVFGVIVTEDPTVRAWHPDVRFFTLDDAATSEHHADLYLDLFARDGKSPGAWAGPLDPGSNRRGSRRLPPVVQLGINIAPPVGSTGPLLLHDDVVTLFHEFGHALEVALGRAEVTFPNASWNELDFAEAPSQLLENWAWAPRFSAPSLVITLRERRRRTDCWSSLRPATDLMAEQSVSGGPIRPSSTRPYTGQSPSASGTLIAPLLG